MKISEVIKNIPHSIKAGRNHIDKVVKAGYCSDLLSRVMAKGPKEGLWITVQTHTNIIAVATLLDIACIIVPEDISVEEATIEKAEEEGIVIISTSLGAFELAGKFYEMGIRG